MSTIAPVHPRHATDLLKGGGECGSIMRAMNWDENPLGPVGGWPPELRTVVAIALGSKQPMFIVWGPDQIVLYNDSYAPMCGNRHPAALGGSFRDLWFDIWDQVEPLVSAAYAGISTSMDDIELLMHRHGYPEETHFSFSYSPIWDPDGKALGLFCACVETTAQVLLQRRLDKEREQMRRIFELALGAVAIVEGPDHLFTFANEDFEALIGRSDIIGRPVAEVLPEVVEQGFVGLLKTVRTTGEAYIGRNVLITLHKSGEAAPETLWLDFNYHPIPGRSGKAEGIFVQVIDVTERATAEQQQKLVNEELAHRMKNQLALVQAVAFLTLHSAPDMAAARKSLDDRIRMLARAQDSLLSGAVGAGTLGTIVRQVAALFDDGAARLFHIDGPEVAVGDRAALSLALMLHELATNAAKYGALSAEGGRVSIIWQIETDAGEPILVLHWRETGGPPVDASGEPGSGSKLLRGGVSGAGFSEVELALEPEGARCTIRADLSGIAGRATPASPGRVHRAPG